MIRSIIVTGAALAALPMTVHAQTAAPTLPEAPGPKTLAAIEPRSWVTNNDYPPEAMRAFVHGTVHFEVKVDGAGKVTDCTILGTSGSELLDSTTCTLLRQRARFDLARDKKGKPIPATYNNRILWQLPVEEGRFDSWARVLQFDLSPAGEISRCFVETSKVPTQSDACDQMTGLPTGAREKLASKSGPVTVEIRGWQQIDGMPAIIDSDPAGVTTVFRRETHFGVDDEGNVSRCDVLQKAGEDLLKLTRYDCHPGLHFPAIADGGTTPRGATAMLSVTTRPAGSRGDGLPPRYTGTPLAPIEAGSWVTPGDYPPAAIRAEAAGVVQFQVDVDAKGAVSGCRVTGSSGSELLDQTTCTLIRQRARFTPARGPGGEPVASNYANRVSWEMPEAPAMPLTSWAAVARFTIGVDGGATSCTYKSYAAPKSEDVSPCTEISAMPRAAMRALRGQSKGPVTIVLKFDHLVEGAPLPQVPALAPKFKQITLWNASFDIDPHGDPVNCHGTIDGKAQPMPATCGHAMRYGHQDVMHSASVRIGFFTDGDAGVASAVTALGDVF